MANPKMFEAMLSKELKIYYLLDTSSSMIGAAIAALNDAMRATIKELKKIDAGSNEAVLRIGVLQFNSGAEWVTVNAEKEAVILYAEDFPDWRDLSAEGLTALGAALTELDKKLSRNGGLQQSETGNWAPVVIIMSDGYPNDSWKPALEELQKNKWYQQAIKIAFALGENADVDVLSQVVGTSEAVIHTNDLEAFKKAIQLVSVTSSLAGSTSTTTGIRKEGKDIVKEVGGKYAGNGKKGETVLPAGSAVNDRMDDIYAMNGAAIDFGNQSKFK